MFLEMLRRSSLRDGGLLGWICLVSGCGWVDKDGTGNGDARKCFPTADLEGKVISRRF